VNAIVDEFDRLWRTDPARPLIHLPSRGCSLTASDLQRKRRQFITELTAAGIRDGHIVLSRTGNRPSFFPLLLAAWSVGAVVMPVDEGTRDHELDELASQFGVAADVRAGVRPVRAARPLDEALTIEVRPQSVRTRHPGFGLLKLTSGSTGARKAVAVPPVAMINDTSRIIKAMGIRPDDTQIAVIPLSHAYGFGNLVLPLFLQGTPIVLREAFVPQAIVADARRYQARVMPGVPFMFQHLAANPPRDGWPPSLTWLISAAARLDPGLRRAFHDRFGVKIHSFYGTTETGGIAFDDSDVTDDSAAVGWPMPGVTVELHDSDAVPEAYGLVHVRSDAVAPGYVPASADDGQGQLSKGFLTGDYGTILSDGRLVLAGRISTFINVAGRKVQPGEIEQALRDMPGVVDARVLAVADSVRGEQVAAVVAGGAVSRAAIRQFCVSRLPSYKVPRVIVVVPELPLTARGKPDTRAIQALAEAAVADDAML
jgi:acyl-CoA synthetase (AMP-forming)/AMP-acid ligase II